MFAAISRTYLYHHGLWDPSPRLNRSVSSLGNLFRERRTHRGPFCFFLVVVAAGTIRGNRICASKPVKYLRHLKVNTRKHQLKLHCFYNVSFMLYMVYFSFNMDFLLFWTIFKDSNLTASCFSWLPEQFHSLVYEEFFFKELSLSVNLILCFFPKITESRILRKCIYLK